MSTMTTVTPTVHPAGTAAKAASAVPDVKSMLFASRETEVAKGAAVDATASVDAEGNVHIVFPQRVDVNSIRRSSAESKSAGNYLYFTVKCPPIDVVIADGDEDVTKSTKTINLNVGLELGRITKKA